MGVGCSSRSLAREGSTIKVKGQKRTNALQEQISLTSSSGVNLHVKKQTSVDEESRTVSHVTEPPIPVVPSPVVNVPTVPGQHNVVADIPAGKEHTANSAELKPPEAICQLADCTRQMLLGRLEGLRNHITSKTIKLFICSSGLDFLVERNAVVERLSVRLRLYCAEKGYELHIVDLNTEPRPTCLGNTPTNQLCRSEIQQCQNLSAIPLFLILLGDTCGEPCVPERIEIGDYQLMLESGMDTASLTNWFIADDNTNPRGYFLQPIKSAEKNITNEDREKQQNRWTEWLKTKDKLVNILSNSSVSQERKKSYLKPELETQIEAILECQRHHGEKNNNIILIKRTFLDTPQKSDSEDEGGSKDWNPFPEMVQKMEERLNRKDVHRYEIPWTVDGLDPTNVIEHAKYLNNFCDNFKNTLCDMIDSATKKRQEIVNTSPPIDIPSILYEEVWTVLDHCKTVCDPSNHHKRSQCLEKLNSYIDSNKSHPMIITGSPGSGKSSLAANIASHRVTKFRKHATVIRFMGLTPSSGNINQVLQNICEQLGLLYGTQIPKSIQPISKCQTTFSEMLSRATEECPLLVIIDGIDRCRSETPNLDWLPRELPWNVKLILTTRDTATPFYDRIQELFPQTDCFLSIPELDGDLATKLFESMIGFDKITPTQRCHVEEQVKKCRLPMQVKVLGAISLACQSEAEWKSFACGDVDKLVETFFQRLTEDFPQTVIAKIFSYLVASRHGLTDAELNDILSCDETVLQHIYSTSHPKVRRSPPLVWAALKRRISPLMETSHFLGNELNTFLCDSVRDVLEKSFLAPHQTIIHSNLADYFDGRWANGKHKPYPDAEGGIDMLSDRYVIPQPAWFTGAANVRQQDELPFQMCHSQNNDDFMTRFLFNASWLKDKISRVGLYALLDDINFCDTTKTKDLEILFQALSLSSHALSVDPNQLSQQLIGRLKPLLAEQPSQFPLLENLLEDARQLNQHILLSSGRCLLDLVSSSTTSTDAKDVMIDKLLRVTSDVDHVISIASSKGEVCVWNVASRNIVRAITGLNFPREARMFDSHRVAILCDREVKIYDLDTGEFQSKLKGVLNANMPYYGIHDEKHIVALSRNRMYVNLHDTDTGDMVSTFKVGESRFLNSLLASDNGQMLVCGDETQKPFPLLVWNLHERKLIHDLRIARHEFLTNISDITKDGHFVVCVCKELDDPGPNFLVVYDLLTGQLFKKWKPAYNTTCVAISTPSKTVINGISNGSVLVWGLTDGSCRFNMKGAGGQPDLVRLSIDGQFAITLNQTTVCLYDLHKGLLLGSFTPDHAISCCEISAEGRHVILGLKGQHEIATLQLLSTDYPRETPNASVYGDSSREGQTFDLSHAG